MQTRVLQKTRAYSRRKEKKSMLSTIEAINSAVNNFIWGVPAMICIIGVGLVLSFRTRFLQIRKFPYAMKVTFGRMFKKREASDGAMTPFQAVCTALAATVGTGNIAGVAGAIATAINTALMNYHVISKDAVPTVNLVVGIILAVLIALILLGGIRRIGRVTEKLVPFMALIYIVLAVGVILFNIGHVPAVFASIIEGAFHPAAVTGGAVGSFFMSMKKGVSRGIFSNEAGLGTGSIAHACADTRKPVKQGFFGIFEVFVDTIVICTLTALVILCSQVPVSYGQAAGAELTISGFTATYGNWVSVFTAVAMCCFAFSTIIGWGLYGTRCIEFLFGSRVNKPFMLVYALVAIVGATMDLGLMWSIAETFNGLMAIPNLIAVFLLSGVVVKLVKEYFAGEKTKEELVMKKFGIKEVVATGIGTALFIVLTEVQIPLGIIPNTSMQPRAAVLAFLAAVFGPVVGGIIGLLGHALGDALFYGGVWWSWVFPDAIFGILVGLFAKSFEIKAGGFNRKKVVLFNVVQVVANAIAWIVVAPVLDILIYAEPAKKVFSQGVFAFVANIIIVGVLGSLLGLGYTKIGAKSSSLTKED